jgi:phosphatidylserine/phosphatidylglycerophosphate/cardiolipin synthase-like enzyme
MLGVAMPSHRCQIEADNRPWTSPITTVGVPTLAQGDVLHHKFGVVDGETVIIGSQNWSKAANFGNDENLLVIRNPTVAAHYSREFERLYRTAAVGLTTDLQDRLQDRQQKCQ